MKNFDWSVLQLLIKVLIKSDVKPVKGGVTMVTTS